MPTLKFNKTTSHSPQEAFKRIQTMLGDDPDLRKLDSGYSCQFDDAKLSGVAKGSKFTARLQVKSEGSGGHVELVVELPLILTPFKGMVEGVLQKKLEKALRG